MKHWAKIENDKVINIIRADEDFFDTFVDSTPGTWLQTSYNTRGGVHYEPDSNTPSADQSKALRKNYAGVGYTYDATKDAFIPPQPFPSWTLDEDACVWLPPTLKPENENTYYWDEENQQWTAIEE